MLRSNPLLGSVRPAFHVCREYRYPSKFPLPSILLKTIVQEGDGTIDSTLRVFRERGGARPTMASALSTLSADVVAAVRAAAPAVVARRPSPAEAATAAAEAATAAAAAAASSAGFVAGEVRGARGARTVNGGARSDGKKEARTIVLERCAALVKSYGARRQAIAVDSLLERMEQAGVQMDARFLNCVLVSFVSSRCDLKMYILVASVAQYVRICTGVCICRSMIFGGDYARVGRLGAYQKRP